MSQTSFLEDVACWSEADCKERFAVTVPKLLSCLESSPSVEKELSTLKILTSSFLPCVSVEEAETVLYSKLVPKVSKEFLQLLTSAEKFLADASVHLQEVKQEISTKLKFGLDIIQCIEKCVNHAGGADSLHLHMVHSLTQPVLDVVKGTYGHCKESSTIYGDLIVAVSDQLTALFKRAHALQMVFLSLLDNVVLTQDAAEQEVADMAMVCHELFHISQVVASLDVKIMVTSWKTLSRLICQHKVLLGNSLNVSMVITGLSNSVEAAYQYLFQLAPSVSPQGEMISTGDEKSFMKSVKILGFQVKILMVLVKELLDLLGESARALYSLLLHVHRYVPPSLTAQNIPPPFMNEMRKHVLGPMDTLVSYLIGNQHFLESLTSREETLSENNIPRCQIQVISLHYIAKSNDDVLDRWMNQQPPCGCESIIQATFKSVANCYLELCCPVSLPGVPCNGNSNRDVGLYEYIVTRVSAFACSLPVRHFPHMEMCLLTNVLSSNFHCALLAIDVWCLVARYGTAELCRNHCIALGKLLLQLEVNSGPQYLHLLLLLRRIFQFLAPEHQVDFVHEFPISKCCHLWATLPISSLSQDLLKPTVEKMIEFCIDQTQKWNTSKARKLKDAKQLFGCLRCLQNLFSNTSVVEHCIPPNQRASALNRTIGIWKSLQVEDVLRFPILQSCVTVLTGLTQHMVLDLQTEELFLVLNFLHSLQKQGTADAIRLSISQLLAALGKKNIPPSFQQSQILSTLPEMFAQVLTDPCVMVKQHGLEAFSQFAEETPHEGVVPECLQLQEGIKDVIVDYLNKVPHQTKEPFILEDYLKMQHEALKICDRLAPQHRTTGMRTKTEFPGSPRQEPPAKRSKQDPSEVEDRCREILSRVQQDLGDLADLHHANSLPCWVFDDLNAIQVQLTSLL
ncbi:FIGNL1-interacting regulator of recombination and mitosis-like [Lineus longissimus]|uniref:FIGNL1-interacting regulator of recombination and mitosis-like n=1 Tax=Lineus longissimus TaxID=88925 RepID=UPI002B4C800D